MKTSILICIRSLCLFSLLICLPAFVHAQERLQIADLFSKYGEQKVERNGKKLNRYIIFKIGKDSMGTLIYIEGLLSEKEMMDMLYKSE